MTRAEWDALRQGDVVREVRSSVLRVVLAAHHGRAHSITLLKLRGSRYDPCIFTTLANCDRPRLARTGVRLKHLPHLVCPHPHPAHRKCHGTLP